MKKVIFIIIACVISTFSMAQFASAPAFPGAEGYGRYATGARGANNNATVTIKHVTNLKDSGTGSLRDAINGSNRIIVFDVSGTIELQSALKISRDNITILGQTAPGDGICLKNYTFQINANNVIIRYIRCRMGDEKKTEDDAMNSYRHELQTIKNVIIDHCSMSWSTDECATFYGVTDFSLQWCIMSESLRNSVHDKGKHGYGGIWGGERASFHHNLLAHHDSRNPRIDHDYVSYQRGPVDLINNVIYNWGDNSCYGGDASSMNEGYKTFNLINCYYKPGPYTKTQSSDKQRRLLDITISCSNCNNLGKGGHQTVPAHFYVNGNYMDGNPTVTANNCSSTGIKNYKEELMSPTRFTTDDSRFQYHIISMQTAENAYDKVLNYAGCSYKRDIVDERVTRETREGTYTYTGSNGSKYGLIDTQSDVGGWPELTGTPIIDSDNDGIPDDWEEANGLNPNNASDAIQKTIDSKGYYTNIEVYANSLVEAQIKSQRDDAGETFEEYYPAFKTPTAINSIEYDKSAVKIEYFTLDGRKVSAPVKGISIRKITYSNGRVEADKVLMK